MEIVIVVLLLLLDMEPHVPPDLPLCPSPAEVSLLEVVDTGGVNCPVVAFSIGSPARLDEAVVQREVVPYGVPPAGSPVPEVKVVVQDVLVDVRQHQLLLRAAQDGHADQPDVGVLRLGLLWEGHPEQAGVQLGHGEEGQVGGGAEPGREGEGQGGGLLVEEGGEGGEGELEGGELPHPLPQSKVVDRAQVQGGL